MDLGLLVIRLVIGLLLVGHGTQKLLGWFGGPGLDGAGGFFHSLGHRPGRLMATVAALSETAGGLLLALGLLTPLGSAVVVGVMIVAASVHVANGLWATNGGYELPLTYAVVAAGLAFTGPGAVSLDNAVGLDGFHGIGWGIAAVALAVVAAGATLARRAAVLRADAAQAAGDGAAAYPVDATAAAPVDEDARR